MTNPKLVTGSILLFASEQAFAHAYQIGFPHHVYVSEILVPASVTLLILGASLFVWGLWSEVRSGKKTAE